VAQGPDAQVSHAISAPLPEHAVPKLLHVSQVKRHMASNWNSDPHRVLTRRKQQAEAGIVQLYGTNAASMESTNWKTGGGNSAPNNSVAPNTHRHFNFGFQGAEQ
jgi:hypothetical protein